MGKMDISGRETFIFLSYIGQQEAMESTCFSRLYTMHANIWLCKMCNPQNNCDQTYTGIPPNCITIYFFTLETSENIHFQMENLYWGIKIVTKKGKYNTLWHNSFQARPHSKWSIHWYDRERRMVAGCQINTFLDILVFFSKEDAWIKKRKML